MRGGLLRKVGGINMEVCSKCGSRKVVLGAPHADGSIYNRECRDCGYCEAVYPDREDGEKDGNAE